MDFTLFRRAIWFGLDDGPRYSSVFELDDFVRQCLADLFRIRTNQRSSYTRWLSSSFSAFKVFWHLRGILELALSFDVGS